MSNRLEVYKLYILHLVENYYLETECKRMTFILDFFKEKNRLMSQ